MATRQRQDKATADKHLNILRTLLKDPHNRRCADCTNKDPRWASWNLGIFVCIRCSGVHRSMGTHISRVKSVDLDMWTPEQIQSMVKWGNRLANMYWQAHLKPGHVVPEHKIDAFIRSKYDGRKWARNGPLPSDPRMLETGSGGTSASVNNPITQIQAQRASAGAPPSNAARRAPPPQSAQSQSSLIDIAPVPTPAPQSQPKPKAVPKVQINTRHINKPLGATQATKTAQTTKNGTAATPGSVPAPPPPAPDNGLLDLDLTATSPTNQIKKANKQDIMSLFAKAPPASARPLQQQQQTQQQPKEDLNDAFSGLSFGAPSQSTQSQSSDTLSALWGTNTAAPVTNTSSAIDLLGGGGGGGAGAFGGPSNSAPPPPRASTAPIPPAQKTLLDDDDWGPTTSSGDGDAFDDWGSSSWEAPPPKSQTQSTQSKPKALPAGKIELTSTFSAPPAQPTTSLSFNTTNTPSSFNSFFESNSNSISLNDGGYSDTSSKFSSGTAFADIPTSLNDIPAPSKLTSDPFSAFQSTSGSSLDMSSPAGKKQSNGGAANTDLFGDANAWTTPDPIPEAEGAVEPSPALSPPAEPKPQGGSKSEEKDVWSTPDPVLSPAEGSASGALDSTPAASFFDAPPVEPKPPSPKPSNDLWESFGASSQPSPAPAPPSFGLGDDVWGAPASAAAAPIPATSLTTASSPAPQSSAPADDIWSMGTTKPPTPPSSAPPPSGNPTSLDDVMGNVWA
ncbi:hypothetical protein E3P99_02864 [Wallemia hederae]|uniref:Arf-GAP domain-containing protein n=1 Tax=Wallemia hederae TaxID=1540922 RepID=A0A4T0FI98_9BASI|nr:hypothetical protein E3P99_02864 [Wallemia hederae]